MSVNSIFSLNSNSLISPSVLAHLPASTVTELVLTYLGHLVELRKGNFCYRFDTQDFGVQVDCLDVIEVTNPLETFETDLRRFSQALGFGLRIRRTEGQSPYLRDWFYPIDGYELMSNTAHAYLGYVRLSVASDHDPLHPSSRTKHPAYQTICGTTALPNVKPPLSATAKKNDFFVEGGNIFVVSDPKNPQRKKALIGRHGFMMALLQLRATGFFEKNKYVTEAQYQALIEKYSKGLTKKMMKGEKEVERPSDELNHYTAEMVQLMILQEDLVPAVFHKDKIPQSEEDCSKYLTTVEEAVTFPLKDWRPAKIAVARYLAQKEILMRLIALQFKLWDKPPSFDQLNSDDVILIEPLSYHLDTVMRPGPKGSFFVQSYELCLDFLQRLKAHAQTFNLSAKDLKILDRLIKAADDLNKQLGPIVTAVKNQLEAAGFTVIPAPGMFNDQEEGYNSDHEANFFNSVSGYSRITKRYYYLLLGTKIGDHLGDALMKIWTVFLRQYQPTIDVFYVGNNGQFDTTSIWWTRDRSGLRCCTLTAAQQSRIDN